MKKIYGIIVGWCSFLFFSRLVFGENRPVIQCEGLPGCDSGSSEEVVVGFSTTLISEMIKYVAVLAVIALMFSGIMYMLSGGEEDKIKKAKSWIIWSLVGVIFSMSAWYIVTTLNEININI